VLRFIYTPLFDSCEGNNGGNFTYNLLRPTSSPKFIVIIFYVANKLKVIRLEKMNISLGTSQWMRI